MKQLQTTVSRTLEEIKSRSGTLLEKQNAIKLQCSNELKDCRDTFDNTSKRLSSSMSNFKLLIKNYCHRIEEYEKESKEYQNKLKEIQNMEDNMQKSDEKRKVSRFCRGVDA